MQYKTRRQRYDILRSQLDQDRSTFKSVWRDLSEFILPRRSRFFTSDVNNGERRNLSIIDSSATLSCRTFQSGMMTGLTSPARPWFRLQMKDRSIRELPEVKAYLLEVEEIMRGAFLRSNLYNILPIVYGDFGSFATGCMFMEPDVENIFNFQSFLIGSYMIGCDKKGRVRTFSRDFQMTVRQIVEKFGVMDNGEIDWSNISSTVMNLWDNDQKEVMIDIVHVVEPNPNYKSNSIDSKFKKFSSVYYENGRGDKNSNEDKLLSEKGYDYFPVMAPRWEVAGEDSWGTNSPGIMALGDIKQLQHSEKNIAVAIDQKVKPSMVGPTSLKNVKTSMIPGHITYVDQKEGNTAIRRLFEIDFDIRELEVKQQQIRERISRCFFEDLFLMLAQSDRRQITAREIEERHEEKLLALGPALERVNQDLLDPLIENAFYELNNRGMLPPPPEVLQGEDFEVEYISIMAQAQKLSGLANIDRFVGFVGQMAAYNPGVLKKLNMDAVVDEYAEITGVPAKFVRTEEEVNAINQMEAEQAQAQQEIIQAQQAAQIGKDLGQTRVDDSGTALAAMGV